MKMNRVVNAAVMILCLVLILSCCGCASKEAKAVKQLIKDIGTVTLESRDAIIIAEASYAALSEDDKKAVSNYEDLVEAKESYEDLVNRKAFIELAEPIEKNIVGKHNLESTFESDYDSKTAVCYFFLDTTLEDIQEDVRYNRVSVYDAALDTYIETKEDIVSTYRNNRLMGVDVILKVYLDDKETCLFEINGANENPSVNLFQTLYEEKIAGIQEREGCIFRSIKWGDTYETVLENETAEVLASEEDALMFDIKFANLSSDYACWFDENKVLTGVLVAVTEDFYGDDCFSCFNAYKNELTAIYGVPRVDERVTTNRLAKYTDEIGALQLGYTRYIAQWDNESANVALAMYAEDFGDILVAFRITPKTN